MTRRLERRPDDPAQARERQAEASAPAPASVLDLQRSAGNAAVARVLAREPAADAPVQFAKPASVLGTNPFMNYQPPKLPAAVETAVDQWLTDQKSGIGIQIGRGATSMPEVIDQVRRHVPAANDANPEAIRWRVEAIVGPVPATRRKPDLGGQKAEQESRISNLFPIPPTSVTFGGSQTSIKVGISGAELKAGKGAVKVTADKEGAEAELKGNGAKVGVSGKWDGSEFALKTEVGGVKFESKVHHKGDGWGWSGGLVIPLSARRPTSCPTSARRSAARTPRSPSRSATSRAAGRSPTVTSRGGWPRSSRRSTPPRTSPGASPARRCASRALPTAAAGPRASRW